MTRRRWMWIAIVVVLLMVGLTVLLDPSARVQGWVGGEPFFQDRSATAWERELRRRDEVEAAAATEALAGGGAEAVAVCTWLLRHAPEPQVRSRAINALQKIGKAAAHAGPDLIAALSDGDPLVRSAAARVIGDLAPDVVGAVPVLVGLFPDREAMRAVGEFKQAGAPAVPSLIELLKHADPAVRRQAVRTLGRIGQPALEALPALIELATSDPEPGVREFASAVLGEFESIIAAAGGHHPGAAEILPTLIKGLTDPDGKVRLESVQALGRMEHRARRALEQVKGLATDDPEWPVRKAAMETARKIEASPQ